jgi:5-formyltetrahydrofolate cyclo-ligase
MQPEIIAERRALRARLIAAREALSDDDHRRFSDSIAASLIAHLRQRDFARLAAYSAFRREYDPAPVIQAMIEAGKALALPVVIAKGQPLEFWRWEPGMTMKAGALGIIHPAERELLIPDVIVTPMIGFCRAGYRLGYGAGFYDRTLAALSPRPYTIGVSFELGRLDTINPQPHDIPMDAVVTEAGVFGTAAR